MGEAYYRFCTGRRAGVRPGWTRNSRIDSLAAVLPRYGVLLLVATIAASCSLIFDARNNSALDDAGAGSDDAGPGDDDASFSADPFVVDCNEENCGDNCMPGQPCLLRCVSSQHCGGPVDCGQASECTVSCEGYSCRAVSCQDDVPCKVVCAGEGSCQFGATCGSNVGADRECHILCSGSESCNGGQVGCIGDMSICNVDCIGESGCDDTVSCGKNGVCSIRCIDSSCLGMIDCSESPDCRTRCSAEPCSYSDSITCPDCCGAQDPGGCANCSCSPF